MRSLEVILFEILLDITKSVKCFDEYIILKYCCGLIKIDDIKYLIENKYLHMIFHTNYKDDNFKEFHFRFSINTQEKKLYITSNNFSDFIIIKKIYE